PERLGLVIDFEPPVRIVGSISPGVTEPSAPGRPSGADTSAKPGVSVARPELAPSVPGRTERGRRLQTVRLTPDARLEAARPQPAKPERPRGTWSGAVAGKVLDQDGQALAGASVVAGGVETRVGDDGTFSVTPPSDATLIVKRPGYAKVSVEPTPLKGPLELV